ncbi:MAG: phosphoglucosamine mutase [Myxococcales bacterium]|nr:phosphoglucosamine mutase [Myxococcales bacterium]
MTSRLFGTDGIRGPITSAKLAPENMCRIGRILGGLALKSGKNSILIGRDTRASGNYIELALSSGITSTGINCQLLGIIPSAAVAHATQAQGAAFGLVISASHNPACDNGIKFFGPDGFKIELQLEQLIEEQYNNSSILLAPPSPSPGLCIQNESAQQNYLEALLSGIDRCVLRDKRIVIDCAHGAASFVAPQLFSSLGLDVKIIGASPDGYNINQDVGSEHPKNLEEAVIDFRADLGIAFDGDADRVVFANEKGTLINGDAILALFAIFLQKKSMLENNTLVSTIMSSVALDQALLPLNIKVEKTPVGEIYVARDICQNNFTLGGENSGHLIMFPHTYTGDGIYFALQLIEIICSSARTISELTNFYQPVPSILKNLDVSKKIPLSELPSTSRLIADSNESLENLGRVVVRYSGTENKLRILVEASSSQKCKNIAQDIAAEYEREARHFLKESLI